ncbi:MAG: HD-GYP domain-containing protein, partial [Candidatus Binatia bacterium]
QRLNTREIRQLYLGAFFHDIGKAFIPAEILNKRGSVDAEERRVMMTHAGLGESVCRELGPFEEIAELVGSHHERPNGAGYPRGLRGSEISDLSRILAVIEIYDALRSERSYKKAYSLERSLEILRRGAAAGDLDANVTVEFAKFALKTKAAFPIVPAGDSHSFSRLGIRFPDGRFACSGNRLF